MVTIDTLPGRTVKIEGEEWLYFSGTSYLGIGRHPEFQELLLEGIQQYGTHFGGSRHANIRLGIFEETEVYLARLVGAEAALTVSSGSLAGQLVVKVLQGTDKFYFAPGVHPALFGEGDYSELAFDAWTDFVLNEAELYQENIIVFSNSLDPLHAKKFSFDWLWEFPKHINVTLVLDDSHGLGICGRDGAGIYSLLECPDNVELIVIGSMGKAWGIPGGLILGSQELIDTIWQTPYFGGASPVSPAYLHAFHRARNLYSECRDQLFANIEFFRRGIQQINLFETFVQYPVFYTSKNHLADFLAKKRVMISSFPYPTPQDDWITRVILSAAHTLTDVEHLVRLIEKFMDARGTNYEFSSDKTIKP